VAPVGVLLGATLSPEDVKNYDVEQLWDVFRFEKDIGECLRASVKLIG
jgi:hypothetical protein